MGRVAAAILGLLISAWACADRILLIPLDSRPAAGQFAQMIARMAGVEVRMPPYEDLGRFTSVGRPDQILNWLEKQDLSDVIAVVASTDMIAYGGLIPSRENKVSNAVALQRLQRFARIVRRPDQPLKVYVFSSTMRLAPTSTLKTAAWRTDLARLQELLDRQRQTADPLLLPSIANLQRRVPPAVVQQYNATRARNHWVQRQLIRMQAARTFDYLVIGQDDARPFGPHVPETESLRTMVNSLGIPGLVYFCEGIDQLSNVLLSRALLKRHSWMPKVRIVYSDDAGRKLFANYEAKPIEDSLRDQLLASGARPAVPGEVYDYTLFLNTPNPSRPSQDVFLQSLKAEVDQGFPIAVADINLSNRDGTSDPRIYEALNEESRMVKLLAFAGWNTAGNTMGTAIPAANVFLLARRLQVDPLRREVARREFLLHRFVNDFAYHKYTRPEAYRLIDSLPGATRDETYGEPLRAVNDFVQRDLAKHLVRTFRDQFLGQKFFAGTGQYIFVDMTDVKIFLPWPRAYEVRLEFHLQARPIDQ